MLVTIGTLSGTLTKALAANSVANTFAIFEPSRGVPTYLGMFPGASIAPECPGSVFLVPYGEGGQGSQFSMRIYGLSPMAAPNQGDRLAAMWLPFFLAEFSCTLCNVAGIRQGSDFPTGVDLIQSERLCDTITLAQGDVGMTGRINSTGPGTNLVAYAAVNLQGCERFVLDFQQVDNIGMNCLCATL